MNIFTLKKKHGYALVFFSLLSASSFAQNSWTGAAGDGLLTTLGNWNPEPAALGGNALTIGNGFIVNGTSAVTIPTLSLGESTLNLSSSITINGSGTGTLSTTNNSIINLKDPSADATLLNIRSTNGTIINAGTINVGTPDGSGFTSTLNTRAYIAVGSGSGNTATLNVYANGNINPESSLLRIHHSRDNGTGIVNIYGANINIGNIQLGENNSADAGTSTLNIYSGKVTTKTLEIPRAGVATNANSAVNISGGELNITENIALGNATDKLNITGGTVTLSQTTTITGATADGVINLSGGTLVATVAQLIASQAKVQISNNGILQLPAGTTTDELAPLISSGKLIIPSSYVIDGTGKVLPIKLSSYYATKNVESVILNWTTASEKNNDQFIISRSTNGKDYTEIGSVKGKNVASNYSFIDKVPLAGTNYYQLTQVDFDGTTEVLGIKSANFDIKDKQSFTIYPNPATDKINIKFANENKRSIFLSNINGKVVFKQNTTTAETQIDIAKKLTPGIYILEVNTNGVKESKKIIIQ